MKVYPSHTPDVLEFHRDVKRVFKTKRGRAEEILTKHVSPIVQDLDCKEANKEAYNYLGNKWAIKNKNQLPTPNQILYGIQ